MSRLLGLVHRVRLLFRHRTADRETRDEITYHLECAERAYVQRGMSPADARQRARREFGGPQTWREETARVRPAAFIVDELGGDLHLAFRALRRRPGLVAGITLTLALGIGVNVAMFRVINAVLLQPVPVPNAHDVVVVFQAANDKQPFERTSYAEYKDLAAQSRRLSGLAAVASFGAALQTPEWADQIQLGLISGNYFSVLSLNPYAGRLLATADEGALGTTPYLVISHAYWRRRFAGDRAAVGRKVRIGEQPFTIVGIAPPGFGGTDLGMPLDAWAPATMHMGMLLGGMYNRAELPRHREVPMAFLVGRLARGVHLADAEAELNQALASIRAANPPPRVRTARQSLPHPITVRRVADAATFRDRAGVVRFVTVLVIAVALTLLLACANVANLLSLRGRDRAREIGVRYALGAGIGRIVRQLFAENLLLALCGGVAGIGVAWLTGRLLAEFTLPGGVRLDRIDAGLTLGVLAFAVTLSVLTSLVFGLAPAFTVSRESVSAVLRSSNGRTTRRSGGRTLVAVQVAISLTLLVCASLFIRSVRAGFRTDLGFDPTPLIAMDVEPRLVGYSGERTVALLTDLVARARTLPGVTSAAAAQHVPLAQLFSIPLGAGPGRDPKAGSPKSPAAKPQLVGMVSVTPEYFSTVGVPIVAGRGILVSDRADAPVVAVVNEAMASLFWPGESPIGKQFNLFDSYTYTVVGVTTTLKQTALGDQGVPVAYVALAQDGAGRASIVVRSERPEVTLAAMRGLARQINASIPAMNVRRVSDQVARVLMPQRFGATLLGVFGALALVIAAVGLYSTVAYAASRRTAEIGVRVALGAQRGAIVRLLLREITVAVGVGAVIGLVASSGAAKALAHFLYGVRPLDVTGFVTAAVLLAVGALVATGVPALKAARTDPAVTLRSE